MATNRKDIPDHFYSLDEYFALEHAGDARYEYWDGEVVCMSGGTKEHGQISGNVHYQLRRAAGGGPCRVFTADVAIKTPTLPPYRYPDVSVACGELKFVDIRGVDALTNPVVIIEVMSPSSADRDRGAKFIAYQAIASLAEYLLIAQDSPQVTHYSRQRDGTWLREDVSGLDGLVKLDSIKCSLALRDIYENVEFAV
jgi:Uma2 family endonuclease